MSSSLLGHLLFCSKNRLGPINWDKWPPILIVYNYKHLHLIQYIYPWLLPRKKNHYYQRSQENLVQVIKCFSLEVIHVTSASGSLARPSHTPPPGTLVVVEREVDLQTFQCLQGGARSSWQIASDATSLAYRCLVNGEDILMTCPAFSGNDYIHFHFSLSSKC